ncbi:MAG: glycoside hydrolase family 3 protein [Gemmiger sp.]|nr:glycoside hydrolase family 3 protein [Gemmiger sp.]
MKKYFFAMFTLVLAGALLVGCADAGATPAGTAAASQSAAAPADPAAPSEESAATAAPQDAAQAAPQNSASPDAIEQQISSMSLRQKVGQLFIIRPDSLDPAFTQEEINDAKAEGSTAFTPAMAATLADYPVGGVAIFKKNITDPTQLTAFVADLQQNSEVALLVGVDEEGGAVARLANHAAFTVPQYESMEAVGATGDPENARTVGYTIGSYLAEYGLNLNFAPDADVNTNPDNPVIGSPAFSSDPQVVADMVAAEVAGLHQAGVISCIKHFPGHGDTGTDTHYGCATAEKTWDAMRSCELLPFVVGIAAGTDMVMAAHITTPNATTDGLPASLSHEMLTDKLRGELGYQGIIITDSLAMEAITDDFTPSQAAVQALQAGADILLMPNGLAEAFDGVVAAVESGEITEERLNESLRRVLALKASYGLL